MIDDKVIERIQKLLALAADVSNEHEAALAASRAQDLLRRHNLDVAAVEARSGRKTAAVGESQQAFAVKPGSGKEWRVSLASTVAARGFCRTLYSEYRHNMTIWWIGRPTDVEAAQSTYTYLVTELERLAQEYSAGRWTAAKMAARALGLTFHEYESHLRLMGTHPLTARRSWLEGAVAGVARQMRDEQDKHNDEQTTAMMVVRGAELTEYMQGKYDNLKVRRSNHRSNSDGTAYSAGYETGKSLRQTKKIGGVVAALEG